ncbi:MAG TPA: DMT family transporter [Allosphingosinicella sp.]|nr:DMT family transporter [Allosphingosinicella sp.]
MTSAPPERTGLRDPRILLPFLLITLIWSSTWIVIKDQLGIVPPVWSVSYRFLIAGAAMMAIARLAGGSLAIGRGHGLAALLGLLQFVLNYNFVYASELYITSGLAAVVFALLVVPNAGLAWLLFGEKVSLRFMLGSAVAMAGVGLLFLQEIRNSPTPTAETLTGLGLALLAVLAASVSNVMQLAGGMKSLPIAPMLAWAMLYGGLMDAAFAWATVGAPVIETDWRYWLGLIYLGVVASALAFWLYYRIIRAIGPAKAAYSSVLIPIIAMALSTLFEDYRWSALAVAGGLLAIAGLIIALRSGRGAPPPPEP